MKRRFSIYALTILTLTAVLTLNTVAFGAPTLKATVKPVAKKATPKPAAKTTPKPASKTTPKPVVKATPKPAPTVNPLQAINDDLMLSNTAYQDEVSRLNEQLIKLSELANQPPQVQYVYITPEPTPVMLEGTPVPALSPTPEPTPQPVPELAFSFNIYLEEIAKNPAWLRGVEVLRLGEEMDGPVVRTEVVGKATTVMVGSWNQKQLVYIYGGNMPGCNISWNTWKYCDRKTYAINEAGVFSLYPDGVYYRGLVTPTPIPSLTPEPTLSPGTTPTPVPTLVPGTTPTPVPTLVPGTTPTPVPTLIPGTTPTPVPTLVPGQSTPEPTAVPATVSITFKITYDTKADGDIYLRSGSSDEKMTWTTGNVWTINKSLTSGTNYTYSYVHKYKNGNTRVSSSRSYSVPSASSIKTDSW